MSQNWVNLWAYYFKALKIRNAWLWQKIIDIIDVSINQQMFPEHQPNKSLYVQKRLEFFIHSSDLWSDKKPLSKDTPNVQ
jgi:hypothetical protein